MKQEVFDGSDSEGICFGEYDLYAGEGEETSKSIEGILKSNNQEIAETETILTHMLSEKIGLGQLGINKGDKGELIIGGKNYLLKCEGDGNFIVESIELDLLLSIWINIK